MHFSATQQTKHQRRLCSLETANLHHLIVLDHFLKKKRQSLVQTQEFLQQLHFPLGLALNASSCTSSLEASTSAWVRDTHGTTTLFIASKTERPPFWCVYGCCAIFLMFLVTENSFLNFRGCYFFS